MIDRTIPPTEFEFRDGTRLVQEYLAHYMRDMETYLMTYDQAIAEVNRRMERDTVAKGLEEVLERHFEDFG